MDDDVTISRAQALRYRWRRQGLDAAADSVPLTAPPSLDLGVQDGAGTAGGVALVNRVVTPAAAAEATGAFADALALVWSVRGAPHLVRRDELGDVRIAVSPVGETDARHRTGVGGKALAADGVGAREGLRVLAAAMRAQTPESGAVAKGELSARLTPVLPEAFLVDCRPCGATHPHEQLFRLGALHAGLELEPGVNPPNLRRIPGGAAGEPGPAADPFSASPRLQVIRAYLSLLGPAAPRDVAAFLDTTAGEVAAHWPADARDVRVEGRRASVLAEDVNALIDAEATPAANDREVRLLNGFDQLLAAKDRDLLIPERDRRKQVWPALGRPGVVMIDGAPVGVWRPKSAKDRLTLRVELWSGEKGDPPPTTRTRLRAAIEAQAERIAAARHQRLAAVDVDG